MIQKSLAVLLVIFVGLQFFQIEKINPDSDPDLDFINRTNPPEQIKGILKTACYDCHSYQTKYPAYTYVQPLAWWIEDHIDHGRDELNFSTWGNYTVNRADHKLEEAVEYTLNEEMPLPSYTWTHGDARLSEAQRKELADWFESQRALLKDETNQQPTTNSGH
jgi:hypothetical protein